MGKGRARFICVLPGIAWFMHCDVVVQSAIRAMISTFGLMAQIQDGLSVVLHHNTCLQTDIVVDLNRFPPFGLHQGDSPWQEAMAQQIT
jgi:hypothetical protein